MGRRLDRWRALTARERLQLLVCVPGIWLVHIALAVIGYTRTRRIVERISRHPRPRPASLQDIADARSLSKLAAIAGRHAIGDATCLRRSLLLYGWLRRRGLGPVLQLGVGDQAGTSFRAHAWVELEGAVLMDADAGYRAFDR